MMIAGVIRLKDKFDRMIFEIHEIDVKAERALAKTL